MKKSLKVLASATLAFSLFASVAMADTPATTTTPSATTTAAVKTAADFTDLATATPAQIVAINALLAKGYMDGKTATTFDITGNMTRAEAAKLVAKIFGLTVDEKATSSFGDVDAKDASIAWAIPFIEAAKKAGIIDGVTDATKDAAATFAPTDNVTLGQLATLLVKGFGKAADVKVTTPWYQGYLDVAKANGIDLGTDGAKAATRADLVIGSYAADVAVSAKKEVTAEAKVIGAAKLQVSFSAAVDSGKVGLVVKSNGNTVNTKSITFAEDKKSATLEFANAIPAGTYAIGVSGVAAATKTLEVKVEAEKVVKVEFASDKLVIDRSAGTAANTASISYNVFNQYNEKKNSTALTFTTSKGTITGSNGVAQVTLATGAFTVAEPVIITALDTNSSTFASINATVAAAGRVNTVEITKLDTNSKTLQMGETASNFKFVLNLKDQYGNSITDATYAAADVNVSVIGSSITVGAISYDSTLKALVVPVSSIAAAGKSSLAVVSLVTGSRSILEVDVKDVVKLDTLTLTAPDLAPAGDVVEIPFAAVDQFGAAIANPSSSMITLTATGTGNTAAFNYDVVKDKTTLKLTLDSAASGTVILTGVTQSGKFVQLPVTVAKKRVPTVISEVKNLTSVLKGAEKTVAAADVVVKDQYGKDIALPTGYAVKLSASGDAATTTATSVPATFTAAKKGASTVTVSLTKDGADVANSSFTFNLNVVEKADIASYEATVGGVVYANGIDSEKLVVNGILADGSKVTVNQSVYNFTVSVPANLSGKLIYNTATSAVYADSTLVTGGAEKDATGTLVVTVFGDKGTQVIPVTVNASNKAPVITTLTVKAAGVATEEGTDFVSVELANINTLAKVDAVVASVVTAKDQYGNPIIPSFTNVVSKDPTTVAVKDVITVTAIADNGQVSSFKVFVK